MPELSKIVREDQDKKRLESKWGIQIPPIHLLECISCRQTTVGKYNGIQISERTSETTILYTCEGCKTTRSIRPNVILSEQYVDGFFLPGLA